MRSLSHACGYIGFVFSTFLSCSQSNALIYDKTVESRDFFEKFGMPNLVSNLFQVMHHEHALKNINSFIPDMQFESITFTRH